MSNESNSQNPDHSYGSEDEAVSESPEINGVVDETPEVEVVSHLIDLAAKEVARLRREREATKGKKITGRKNHAVKTEPRVISTAVSKGSSAGNGDEVVIPTDNTPATGRDGGATASISR